MGETGRSEESNQERFYVPYRTTVYPVVALRGIHNAYDHVSGDACGALRVIGPGHGQVGAGAGRRRA